MGLALSASIHVAAHSLLSNFLLLPLLLQLLLLPTARFAPWVSNGGGWQSSTGDADAEWDYWSYLPWATKLLNMGSYEASGDSNPDGNRSLAPIPCTSVPGGDPATVDPRRQWGGLEGTIVDMLAKGAA